MKDKTPWTAGLFLVLAAMVGCGDEVTFHLQQDLSYREGDLLPTPPTDAAYEDITMPDQAGAAQEDIAIADLAPDDAQADIAPADIAPGDIAPIDIAQADIAPGDIAPIDIAQADIAPIDIAQADIAPADIAPIDIAPIDIAQADIAQADIAPGDLAPIDIAPADIAQADIAPADIAQADIAQADIATDDAQADIAPADLAPTDLAPADIAPIDIAQADLAPDDAPADIAPTDLAPDDAPADLAAQEDIASADLTDGALPCTTTDGGAECEGLPHGPCEEPYCDGDAGICRLRPMPDCTPEECTNGLDDNHNRMTDCDDPDCQDHPDCQALDQGEACFNALPINDGQPIDSSLAGQILVYEGDTTAMGDNYRSLCALGRNAPDAVYEMVLAEAMTVTLLLAFAPREPPVWPIVYVYEGTCHPTQEILCMPSEEEITWTLTAGTYYIVVDGDSGLRQDWGAYALTVSLALPPPAELDCDDEMDEDGDGAMDCADSDCAIDPACAPCDLAATLECGFAFSGQLAGPSERHYFAFASSQDANIQVTVTVPEGASDQPNINVKYQDPLRGCTQLYSVSIWGMPPDTWGFRAQAGQEYVIALDVSVFDQGQYTISLDCAFQSEMDCGDGLDNDGDGFPDCEDRDCYFAEACTGGYGGESCLDPFWINDGVAITGADEDPPTLYNTTSGRTNDQGGSCSEASLVGPDAVYGFTLAEPLVMSAVVFFWDWDGLTLPAPSLYLLADPCGPSDEIACAPSLFILSTLSVPLDPGTYFLVIDSDAVDIDGTPDASDYELELMFSIPTPPEDCTNLTDDNDNGLVDCEDPACFDDFACTGGASGETCSDPFVLAGPLTPDTVVTLYNSTKGKQNDTGASCSPVSDFGPDTAHAFTLEVAQAVTASVTFANGFIPSLALYQTSCDIDHLLGCALAEGDTASLLLDLPPGNYILVVDSGDELFGTPMAENYTLTLSGTALPK